MTQPLPAPAAPARSLEIDRYLSLADAAAVARGAWRITLSQAAIDRVARAQERLADAIAEHRHIYGLTTGFGPLANRLVPAAQIGTLQQNLIHHLATGVGPAHDWTEARAILLARLMSMLQGVSGASVTLVRLMVALLNSPYAPCLPSQGTVGASGDLTPLAHIALCLQGRAPFQDRSGTAVPPARVLAALGLPPLDLSQRDGLALVNGTSAMTGLAVLNQEGFDRAATWQLALTAGIAELLSARAEAWDEALCDARPHPGQRLAAAALRRLTHAAPRISQGHIAQRRLTPGTTTTEEIAGQDAYTLRCAPQIVGACLDTAAWHAQLAETELNAATDNPIFPEGHVSPALHGGNFMGCHVALASDALAGAVLVLAGHAERLIARVTDERLSGGLPPFLHRGQAGLNSGLMGAQVTATALLAEMRARGGAAAVQSISTNGANQDVVSMGTIAARIARSQLDQLAHIQAIAALCVAQGRDILAARGARLSPAADALADRVRLLSPPLETDRPLGAEISALAGVIAAQDPPGLATLRLQTHRPSIPSDPALD